jgi:hypothetical protein
VNCDTIHRRLLSLERPDQPPADVRGHLASCPACRAWHRRLVDLESQASHLPVPPPRQKTAFLERLRNGAGVDTAPTLLRFDPPRPRLESTQRERGRQKMAVAVALAATLLLVTLAVLLWTRGGTPPAPTPPGPTISPLADRLEKSARWALAKTPRQRLEVLSDLADEVHDNARKIAQGDSLKEIDKEVRLYREIIDRMTSTEARELKRDERVAVLKPLSERLARAESEAKQLALKLSTNDRLAAAVAPLRELAAAAHDGDQKIRALIQEATA